MELWVKDGVIFAACEASVRNALKAQGFVPYVPETKVDVEEEQVPVKKEKKRRKTK